MLCDPSILGDGADRKVYVDGAAQIASSPEFTNPEQLQELLEAIEEKDRLIALLSGCIEAPEPVHVELGWTRCRTRENIWPSFPLLIHLKIRCRERWEFWRRCACIMSA